MLSTNYTEEKTKHDLTLSIAISVWNEEVELERLLNRLCKLQGYYDEIVIQGDQGKVTDGVVSVIRKYQNKIPNFVYTEYPLNGDFASYKNNLLSTCTSSYIFLIDADEIPTDFLIIYTKELLSSSIDSDEGLIDCVAVPRANVVKGLTDDYVKQCGWKTAIIEPTEDDTEYFALYGIDTNNPVTLVNPFDYQMRIIRNSKEIRYTGRVHERITGFKTYSSLPPGHGQTTVYDKFIVNGDLSFCLFHVKDIERQKKQNEYYNTLVR